MQWRLASTPVANVDHATGDIDGTLVSSGRNTPFSASLLKFGIRPSSMNFVARPGVEPVEAEDHDALALRVLVRIARPRRGGRACGSARSG
jgi:hypothetical protein